MTVERFDVATLPVQPWKNGAGTTREIACAPAGAGVAEFDWRFSVAAVEGDAPFSAFPGVDRCIVLLEGAGMELRGLDGGLAHRLERRFEAWAFPGELALSARLLGGPNRDFNVMTRRGRWRSEVQLLRGAAPLGAADALLLYCAAGRWRIDGHVLAPQQGLLWRTPVEGLSALPLAGAAGDSGACLIAVRLCEDAPR